MSAHQFLGTAEYPYSYYEPGENVDGDLVLDDPIETTIQARIQAKTDGLEQYRAYSDAHRLKVESQIAIFGDDVLHTESSDGLRPAGRLTYRDRVYEIVRCDDNRDSVLPHVYSVGIEVQA